MRKLPILAAVSLTVLSLSYASISTTAEAQIRIQPPQPTQPPATVQPGTIVVPGRSSTTPAPSATPAPSGPAQLVLPASITGVSVSETQIRAHVLEPQHLRNVTSDDGVDPSEAIPLQGIAAAAPGTTQAAIAIPNLLDARKSGNESSAPPTRVNPPAVRANPPTRVNPPAVRANPGAVRVSPGSVTVQPPSVTADPGGVTVQPGTASAVPSTGAAGNLTGPTLPKLNLSAFADDLHDGLKDSVTGYFMRLIENGQTRLTLQWNWAKTPTDGGEGWNPNRNMHIASVSKTMTAIGLTRLLDEKGISVDTPIINFLPTYWSKGPNINQITFRHLMTHRSGFCTGGSSSSYQTMKSLVAAGVRGVGQTGVDKDTCNGVGGTKVGGYDYENANFGIGRILMAVINGNISKDTTLGFFPGLNDAMWDIVTIDAYNNYMQQKVFGPAGVNNATLSHQNNGALAYTFPASGGGWNSGDLKTMAGGAAWHLSPNDLLRVMARFRRGGAIMPAGKAQTMLDSGFGIDRIINSPAGNLYEKNGLWRDGNGRTEQNVAYFLPGAQELVVFVNSPVTSNGVSLRNLVRDTYLANVQ